MDLEDWMGQALLGMAGRQATGNNLGNTERSLQVGRFPFSPIQIHPIHFPPPFPLPFPLPPPFPLIFSLRTSPLLSTWSPPSSELLPPPCSDRSPVLDRLFPTLGSLPSPLGLPPPSDSLAPRKRSVHTHTRTHTHTRCAPRRRVFSEI